MYNFLLKITLSVRVTKNSETLIAKIVINKEELEATCGNFAISISFSTIFYYAGSKV